MNQRGDASLGHSSPGLDFLPKEKEKTPKPLRVEDVLFPEALRAVES